MNSARDFYARPGEKIAPKLRALARFILAQRTVTSGAGIRRHQTKAGTALVADLNAPVFAGAFSVRVAESKATIGHGTCNGLVPTIEDVPIDGVIDGEQGKVPELDLSDGPDDSGRSWVTLAAVRNADYQAGASAAGEEYLFEIAHVNDVAALDGRPDAEDRGHRPLALLLWSAGGRVQRVVRDVYFNQQHHWLAASRRHLFLAAS